MRYLEVSHCRGTHFKYRQGNQSSYSPNSIRKVTKPYAQLPVRLECAEQRETPVQPSRSEDDQSPEEWTETWK